MEAVPEHQALKYDTETEGQSFLLFRLAERLFAVPVNTVAEIVSYRPVTPLPGSGETLLGLVNLRGAILPVFDLRRKMELKASAPGRFHIIIILQLGNKRVGMLVDTVVAVEEIHTFRPPPAQLAEEANKLRHLSAVAEWNDELLLLLAPETLFADELQDESVGEAADEPYSFAIE